MSGEEKGWKFPSNNGGEEKGFNDAGIEGYAGTPFESVAREVIQNSLDASLNANLSDDSPVTVSFEYEDVSAGGFPSRDDLLIAMKKCLEACKDEEKAEHFFQEAQKMLQKNTIGCLKISDHNTTGMRDGKNGDLKSGQWWGLVKKSGKSQKASDTAGGSFGIGKHAPFVVSALRTVFYSTRYTDESVVHQFAQGKSILVSHDIGDDEALSQAVGFYGIKKGLHRLENSDIPELLRRDNDGSTLLIAGLRDVDNWRDQIISAVISNYFYAIHAGWLKVSVDAANAPAHIINKDKLKGFFDNNREISKKAHYYYRAICEKEPVEDNVEGLGKCKLWILQEEGAPQGVAILRRGMQITDKMGNLGHRSWRSCSDFAAVFMCEDNDGNALLRGMENPTHDKFDFDRLLKKEDKARGKKALQNLRQWIKDKVQEVAGNISDNVTPLDRMSYFFGYPEEGLPGDQDDKDFDGGSHIERHARITRIPELEITDNDIIEPDPDPDPDPEPNPNPNPSPEPVPGPRPIPSKIPRVTIPVVAVRILPEDDGGLKKRVMFTPTESADAILCLNIAGDSYVESEHIKIMSAEGGVGSATIEDGKVRLTVSANVRVNIHVALSAPVKNDALHLLVEKTSSEG